MLAVARAKARIVIMAGTNHKLEDNVSQKFARRDLMATLR
jgi:hypothetical protein